MCQENLNDGFEREKNKKTKFLKITIITTIVIFFCSNYKRCLLHFAVPFYSSLIFFFFNFLLKKKILRGWVINKTVIRSTLNFKIWYLKLWLNYYTIRKIPYISVLKFKHFPKSSHRALFLGEIKIIQKWPRSSSPLTCKCEY